jgi:hypothetical protein
MYTKNILENMLTPKYYLFIKILAKKMYILFSFLKKLLR